MQQEIHAIGPFGEAREDTQREREEGQFGIVQRFGGEQPE